MEKCDVLTVPSVDIIAELHQVLTALKSAILGTKASHYYHSISPKTLMAYKSIVLLNKPVLL